MQFSSRMSEEAFVATEAIVLYRRKGVSGRGFATVHDVEMENETPVIQAGRLLGTSDMASLMMKIMPSRRLSLLDNRLLALNEQDMVWWCPPSKQRMWFNTSGGDGLGVISGQAWQPGLVFCAGESGWRVFAVKGEEKPGADTVLHQAPHYNVNEEGLICRGTVEVPGGVGCGLMKAYEDAFFGSRFTHPNIHTQRKLTLARGGAGALWKRMLQGRVKGFPESTLVPKKLTVAGLISAISGRYE